jgi:hypothetical protein
MIYGIWPTESVHREMIEHEARRRLPIHGFDGGRSFRVKVAADGSPLNYHRLFHQGLIELNSILNPVVADVAKPFRCVCRLDDS